MERNAKNAHCSSQWYHSNYYGLSSEFGHFSEAQSIFSKGITALTFCSTFVLRQKWKKAISEGDGEMSNEAKGVRLLTGDFSARSTTLRLVETTIKRDNGLRRESP